MCRKRYPWLEESRADVMMHIDETEHILMKGSVREDSWGFGHIPKTEAALVFLPETGFAVYMRCMETNPRTVCREPDSPVYQDSCMECFLNLYPGEGKRYLNFEVNSSGTMLCQAGDCKSERTFLRSLGIEPPKVTVRREDWYWEICYIIPFSLIRKTYGKRDVSHDFRPGAMIKGNFYKCGDLTEYPHYGSWRRIGVKTPDFHQPDFFGEIEIR